MQIQTLAIAPIRSGVAPQVHSLIQDHGHDVAWTPEAGRSINVAPTASASVGGIPVRIVPLAAAAQASTPSSNKKELDAAAIKLEERRPPRQRR